jgi:Ser/Thr protein kinase RdoA (MazF antagonist)
MYTTDQFSISPAADVAASLATFDALERGEAAPSWILDGICSRWALTTGPVAAALIAVSENATFRVTVAGTPLMVVRLHRPGYVGDPASIRSELQWVEALTADTDIRTPAPIRGSNGELVQLLVDARGRDWNAVAFEYVRGEILEQRDDLSAHYTEIGTSTALLHSHSRSWKTPPGFRRFTWTVDDMVGESPRWGSWRNAALSAAEYALVDQARSRALRVLEPLTRSPDTWGLIHSDLRPSNVMVEDSELTIIDFDDSGFSWYLYDFASALTFYEHRPEAVEMAANWMDGFSTVTPLSRDDRAHAGALSLIRRLTMLGWATTHREDALPVELWAENLPGTIEVAARYLANPLWLVDPT